MIGGDQVLAPVLGPGHRALELARQPHHHDVFAAERHFLAEAAADVGRDHAQIALRHAEHVGDGGAHEMRHLRGAGQRDAAAGGVIGGVRRARLHRRRVLPVRARLDGDDLVRAVPDRVEAGGLHFAFEDDIAGRLGVHLRRAGGERGERIDHRHGRLDHEIDLLGDVFGVGCARSHDGGDRLADKAHDAVGQDRLADRPVVELVQHRQDFLHALEIGGGDDHRAVRRIDPRDFSRRQRAAHEAHPMRRRQVGGEAALALDQRRVFQPADGAADPGHAGAFGVRVMAPCAIVRT